MLLSCAPYLAAGGGYQCSLHKLAMTQGQEAAEWNQTNCNATKTYTGLPNGSYEFRVQVRCFRMCCRACRLL